MQPTHTQAVAHQSEHSHSHHHIVPFKVNMAVGITLLILTTVTVWIAQFDFGAMDMVVAMTVATVKAGLVVAYFMHLNYNMDMPLFEAFEQSLLGEILSFFASNVASDFTQVHHNDAITEARSVRHRVRNH